MKIRIADPKILGDLLLDAHDNGTEFSGDVAEALVTAVGELYSGCLLPLEPLDEEARAKFAELDATNDWWG